MVESRILSLAKRLCKDLERSCDGRWVLLSCVCVCSLEYSEVQPVYQELNDNTLLPL